MPADVKRQSGRRIGRGDKTALRHFEGEVIAHGFLRREANRLQRDQLALLGVLQQVRETLEAREVRNGAPLRAAGAEAIEIGDGNQAVRAGVDTWIVGAPGTLTVDGKTLSSPYSVLAIGDPPTLAAAMNIPGGAMDSVKRVGATMSVQQGDNVEITALRQPKLRQYAQPVK